jgi:cytosine/adenosine deaminase-related metal-dependent hydrolase
VIERLAELDISVATVAPGGRVDLPVLELVRAGVRLGLGMDGQRDYWHPYGNGDMFDRAYQLAFTQGFDTDPELELAMAIATCGGRSVIDASADRVEIGARPGVAVGDPADLVLFPAESVAAGVMDRPAERTVFHAGVPVAVAGQLL